MAKYEVYALYIASRSIGQYEAESKEEAIKKAESDDNADLYVSMCWQCSKEIDVNSDPYKFEADEL